MDKFSKDALFRRSEEIINLATSQQFLDQLKAVLDAKPEDQLDEAARRFSPQNLTELGVELSPDTRISSRIFDEESGRAKVLGAAQTGPTANLNFSLPPGSPALTPGQIEKLVDRKAMLERTVADDWGVCVCAGRGLCVGAGVVV